MCFAGFLGIIEFKIHMNLQLRIILPSIIALFSSMAVYSQDQFLPRKTENIIIITLDGFRWQELYKGAERRLISGAEAKLDTNMLMSKFWSADPAERRAKLLPYIWSQFIPEGQAFGNRNAGNEVAVANNHWFSYPGYSEMFCGFADDSQINSNDARYNPNVSVLEFLNQTSGFKGSVAAFTSWEVFPWILNAPRSGIFVNSGYSPVNDPEGGKFHLLNQLAENLPREGDTRPDALTFHYALEYLRTQKPRVLYISFDETDHFAHNGNYGQYLLAANRTDAMIRELCGLLDQMPEYKDKTTVILTTDHGRGNRKETDWRHHGRKMEGSDQIWLIMSGPDTKKIGEIRKKGNYLQSQTAQTIADLLGLRFSAGQKSETRTLGFNSEY